METTNQNTNLLMGALTGLMLLFLAGGLYYRHEGQQLTHQNDLTERRADSLLSVKLQLEGDLRNLDTKLDAATAEKTTLDQQFTAVNNRFGARERTIETLRRNTGNQTRSIRALNQSMTDLNLVRDSLENQMAAVIDKVGRLTDANSQLTGRNTALDQQVAGLHTTLLTNVSRSVVTGDAFRVETMKGNRKETAKAKKVNALTVSFSVPAELGLTGTQSVYLSLTDAQHNAVLIALHTTTINLPMATEVVPVHGEQSVNFDRSPQRISFSITPDKAMKPGLYRASVYTKDAYLGTVEFQLRDSFWFF